MDELLECDSCNMRWVEFKNDESCPRCGHESITRIGDGLKSHRGKTLYQNCDDLDDMIDATEQRLELLKTLRDDGFEVSDGSSMVDDYIDFWRIDEEHEDQ